jgi:hypothetical protein
MTDQSHYRTNPELVKRQPEEGLAGVSRVILVCFLNDLIISESPTRSLKENPWKTIAVPAAMNRWTKGM